MISTTEITGPKFIRYFPTIVLAMQQLGGSATKTEIKEAVAALLNLSDAEINDVNAKGTSVYASKIHWGVWYLSRAGYLVSSKRGVWTLSGKGQEQPIGDGDCLEIFKQVRQSLPKSGGKSEPVEDEDTAAPEPNGIVGNDHRPMLLETLRNLPPSGFERLCQRILRESGFQHVVVTGKSNDGGIDGVGTLQINPVLSFRVLFQCKRYTGSVSAGQIRDFRGAMMGRADKGVFITTGTFTVEAQREAMRDGVPPIELVDAEKLMQMFEDLQLGLKPRMVYEIDVDFFKEFS